MARILVCYFSKSGTTERMAKEIVKGMKESEEEVEVDLLKPSEVDVSTLPSYDGLLLGSPTYYGLPAAEIKEIIDESVKHHGDLEGMVGGAFTSSANPAGGNETTIVALLEALLIHGMIVKGIPGGDHYGPVVIGEPDERELKQCRNYGREIVKLVNRIRE